MYLCGCIWHISEINFKFHKERFVKKVVLGLGLLVASVVYADVVSQNGIAKDSATGLVWQDEPYTSAEEDARISDKNYGKAGNWEYAKKYCQDSRLGGFSDWRLPNIYELVTLIDNTKSKAPYAIRGMQNVALFFYWSSITSVSDTSFALGAIFDYGDYSNSDVKRHSNYIRCVRGEQMDFDTLTLLKKSGKVKVSQKNINKISPVAEAKRKKEADTSAQQDKEREEKEKQQNASRSLRQSTEVTFIKEQNKASLGERQNYTVGCSDGSFGIVYITDTGKSYGNICASNANKGYNVCKGIDWSVSLAAQAACGN